MKKGIHPDYHMIDVKMTDGSIVRMQSRPTGFLIRSRISTSKKTVPTNMMAANRCRVTSAK